MKLMEADIPALSLGAAMLGTGGGGDPYVGALALRGIMRETGIEPRIISAATLHDDALVVPVGMFGSPAVGLEKLVSASLATDLIRDVEARLHRKVDAVIPAEIGGVNSLFPLMAAAALDLPVVDADGMGRAFPTIDRTTFGIYGVPVCPIVMRNDHGESISIDVSDAARAEHLCRIVGTEFGGAVAVSVYMMSGRQAKDTAIHDTLTLALDLGRSILAARSSKSDPFDAMSSLLGARERPIASATIFDGKVVDVRRRMEGGYNVGHGIVEGLDGFRGQQASFTFQNEFLDVRLDGRAAVMVPDLICVLERETAQPITCETIRYGQRVRIVAIEADPAIASERAMAVCGPRSFGIDEDYRSFREKGMLT